MRASNFSLQSTELRWSDFVGSRTKVHLLGEGYHVYQRREIFPKIQERNLGEIEVSGLGSAHEAS